MKIGFGKLQRLGKAMMLSVAVLPAAALLLRLGQPDVFKIPFMAKAGGAAGLSGAVYYFIFVWVIKALDIPTPGRVEEEMDGGALGDLNISDFSAKLVERLGGKSNIDTLDACITRLRMTVKDANAIDEGALKSMGIKGKLKKANNIQVVAGTRAELNEYKKVAAAVEGCLESVAAEVDLMVCTLQKGGRVIYIGSGTSGKLAVAGCRTIGISCPNTGKLNDAADVSIVSDVGPEVIEGSTRLKAGTAQKMILNMLSSFTMVKLGKTYGNLMANVRPINLKLRKRAIEIIMYAAGCKEEDALEAFEKAGGNAKAAIILLTDNNDTKEA